MRFLHLAPAARERSIRRSGLAGARASFPDAAGAALVLPRAVYAMPVVPDFWTSHQWTREMRRRNGERLVAVHFRLPDDELVHVGRYAQPHRLLPAAAAARWVMDHPEGAEIVVPRKVTRREVVAVRQAPQLVGWVQSPDEKDPFGCVCAVCLADGTPELMRRVRAAFRAGLDQARRSGGDEDALVDGLSKLQTPLEPHAAVASWDGDELTTWVSTQGMFSARDDTIPGQPDTGASFSLASASLRGCYVRGASLSLGLCAGAGVDRIGGKGFGPIFATEGTNFAPFLGGGLLAGWRMSRWVAPFLSAEAAIPLVRARFSIDHLGQVYQPAAVSLRGAAGFEVRFR